MRLVGWPLPLLVLAGALVSTSVSAQTSQPANGPVVAKAISPRQPNTQSGRPWARIDFGSAEQQSRGGGSSSRGYVLRPFLGIIDRGSTGLQLGLGAAGRPFNNDDVEVQVDGSFIRIGGHSSFGIAPSVLYNIDLDSEDFTPFVGAGLNAMVNGDDSDLAFQILGGLEIPLKSGQAFRGEIRLGFFDGTSALAVLGGFSF